METPDTSKSNYTEEHFKTLPWNEHIRLRAGMYIGTTGDGSMPDDGLYVLLKEVIDNSIDEYIMGFGKIIRVQCTADNISVRDYGRGIPLGKVREAASVMNTGAKYDSVAFQKSVGLNGVGLKAVNAMSSAFYIQAFRSGKSHFARFSQGELLEEGDADTTEKDGTFVSYTPDRELFAGYQLNQDFIEKMVKHYCYVNSSLHIQLNGTDYYYKNGLLDLINDSIGEPPLYEPIHLKGRDIEIVITHATDTGENIYSYVNGQNTTQGGAHLSAFREAIAKTIKEFYKKDFEPSDVRQSIVGAISIRVIEPKFGNQPKTLLSSKSMGPQGPSIHSYILDFVQENLDNYLHKNPQTAEVMLKKIQESEKERKAVASVRKTVKAQAKKMSLHNSKLRDCRIHYKDKDERADRCMIFITEGDSASGSITKSRNPNLQAVFSLRGKPLNAYAKGHKATLENEELSLLRAALNIEEDLENLRYNKVVIATDADPDGMHIRLLLVGFFLQYYPELIRQGHLYILQTPLFRVRNKKEIHYCYSEAEKEKAVKSLGTASAEITRFKGLGEISPDEFVGFIGDAIRLDRIRLDMDDKIVDLLEFYLSGDNPGRKQGDLPGRRSFIENNLRLDVE